MIRVRRETMLGLRNPNSPLAPNPLPRMSRQAGPFLSGNRSRVGYPSSGPTASAASYCGPGQRSRYWNRHLGGRTNPPPWSTIWARLRSLYRAGRRGNLAGVAGLDERRNFKMLTEVSRKKCPSAMLENPREWLTFRRSYQPQNQDHLFPPRSARRLAI